MTRPGYGFGQDSGTAAAAVGRQSGGGASRPNRLQLPHMIKPLARSVASRLFPTYMKERAELAFWRKRKQAEGDLDNAHYQQIYTTWLGLRPEDFDGKSILDIGCGPRGSLEWAAGAGRRVGLDPLADEYLRLGADKHAMTYVSSGSEKMPFGDAEFDVVCSINSLDHVEDVDASLAEIARVCRPGGLLLLVTEVNHKPTTTEPHSFSWDIAGRLCPPFAVDFERRYEVVTHELWNNVRENHVWNTSDATDRPGLLFARLRKSGNPADQDGGAA